MKKKLIALYSILYLSSQIPAWSRPEFFSDYSLDQAQLQAQKDHKFLLIDFTASWCSPCKKMEATSWIDQAVQSWIKENAIAIQVDVDKDEKTTNKFKVTAMPTLVLFTPADPKKEFGRQDGYLSASELMQWFEGAKSGKSAAELEKDLSNSGGTAIWDHMSKANELQASGKNSEAFTEFIWLWNNIRKDDPNMGNLRVGHVPLELKKLSKIDPAAKAKLSELRDAADTANKRDDWIILNGVLDDNERTLAWFDKNKTDSAQRESIMKNTSLLEPVLFSNMRWVDAANYLYPEPLTRISEYYKRSQDMKKPRPDTEFAKDFDPFPSMVMLLYGAYVGANREAEAQKIADECLRLDNTDGMREALSNMAKGMRQARDSQKVKAK